MKIFAYLNLFALLVVSQNVLAGNDVKPSSVATTLLDQTRRSEIAWREKQGKVSCRRLMRTPDFKDLEAELEIDIEFECSKVFTVNTVIKPHGFIRGRGWYEVNQKVLCEPRSFSDRALISLYRACLASGKEECIQIASQLDQVNLTKYFVINKGASCGAL